MRHFQRCHFLSVARTKHLVQRKLGETAYFRIGFICTNPFQSCNGFRGVRLAAILNGVQGLLPDPLIRIFHQGKQRFPHMPENAYEHGRAEMLCGAQG